ncbi:MAG: tetratricopeptide repeat protein [Nitrospirota bacterium]
MDDRLRFHVAAMLLRRAEKKPLHRLVFALIALLAGQGVFFWSTEPVQADGAQDWSAANEAYEQRDFKKAITFYTRAIDGGEFSGHDLAKLYLMRGQSKYEQHGVRWPRDVQLLQSALSDLSSSIGLYSDFAASYNARGAIYSMLDEYEKAIADYSKAIHLQPDHFWAYNNRCLAYEKLGRKEKAMEDCRKALQLDPDHWQPRETLQRLSAKGQPKSKSPADPRLDAAAHFLQGRALQNKGLLELAIAHYDQGITLHPTSGAYSIRAEAYLMKAGEVWASGGGRDDLSKAVSDLDKAMELTPEVKEAARVWSLRAVAHFMLGEVSKGCDAAVRACQLGDCGMAREFSECEE